MCLNKKNQRTLSSSLRAFLLQTATRMPESRSGHSSASPLLQQDRRPAVISPRWPYALCLRCSRVPLPEARRCELKIPCPRGSGGRSSATVFGRWLHLATCLSGETPLLSRAVKSQRTPTPFFASKNDPSDGAETGAAEPHIAEQSRSWRSASGEREVKRGS
jgi:hypothetical protein